MKAGEGINLHVKQHNNTNNKTEKENKTVTVQFFLKQKKTELLKLSSLWFVQVTNFPFTDSSARIKCDNICNSLLWGNYSLEKPKRSPSSARLIVNIQWENIKLIL